MKVYQSYADQNYVLQTLTTACCFVDVDCRVLTLYSDEAERWNESLVDSQLVITVHEANGALQMIRSRPSCISSRPEDVACGCDMIILTMPAFAHSIYMRAIKSYVQPGIEK